MLQQYVRLGVHLTRRFLQDKLDEALKELRIKERFNLRGIQDEVPTGEVDKLFSFFGLKRSLDNTLAYVAKLRSQWEAHRASFRPRTSDQTPFSPKEVFEYWQRLRTTSADLSELVCSILLRPPSSACVERIFSYLTKMDIPSRRTMGPEMLYATLYLRGNWHIVRHLLTQIGDSIRASEVSASKERDEESRKRMMFSVMSSCDMAHDAADLRGQVRSAGAGTGSASVGGNPVDLLDMYDSDS